MTPGATYSPGEWIALVSRTAAVLIDPEVPGPALDTLWRAVESGQGVDAALDVLAEHVSNHTLDFALAVRETESVRLVIGGALELTVQQPSGNERLVRGGTGRREERAALDDVVWFTRPGGRTDGLALPIAIGAVLADMLSWQSAEPAPAPGRMGLVPGRYAPAGMGTSRPVASARLDARAVLDAPAHGNLFTAPAAVAGGRPDDRNGDQRLRRSPGLGSHPRRRYGPADWSLTPHDVPEEVPSHGIGIDTAVPEIRAGLSLDPVAERVAAAPRGRRAARHSSAPADLPSVEQAPVEQAPVVQTPVAPVVAEPIEPPVATAPPTAAIPVPVPPSEGRPEASWAELVEPRVSEAELPETELAEAELPEAELAEPTRVEPITAEPKVAEPEVVEPVLAGPAAPFVDPFADPVPAESAGSDDFSWMSPAQRADAEWTVAQPPWEADRVEAEQFWAPEEQPEPVPAPPVAPVAQPAAQIAPEPPIATPAPPAAPPAPVVPPPVAPAAPAPPAVPAEPEVTSTPAIGGASSSLIGVLVFSDGTEVVVDGPVIIGRAPSQTDRDRPARLVTVRGEGRGVSRNHLRIDVGTTGPFAIDLGSRNGSTLTAPGGDQVAMDSWMPYPLQPGSQLTVADLVCYYRA